MLIIKLKLRNDMAITFEQKKRGSGLFMLLVLLTFIGGTLWFGYQVLFASAPSFEPAISQDQQIISNLAKTTLDPSAIVNSPELRLLRKQIPDVTIGQLGRTNPFLSF